MIPLGNPRLHFWLTLGMAKATGVDLQAALHKTRLTRGDYSAMINRCRTCQHAQTCDALLKEGQGCLETAPDFCLNRDLFEALAA
ncbi:MAG: DUF6455 family protein [Pseudomonadota bacterium]